MGRGCARRLTECSRVITEGHLLPGVPGPIGGGADGGVALRDAGCDGDEAQSQPGATVRAMGRVFSVLTEQGGADERSCGKGDRFVVLDRLVTPGRGARRGIGGVSGIWTVIAPCGNKAFGVRLLWRQRQAWFHGPKPPSLYGGVLKRGATTAGRV